MSLLYRMGSGNGSGGDLKPFIINFTCDSGFIGKTVTMEFQGTPHAGETVDNVSGTVASDGTLTLYPMHDGLWKYYATSDVSGYQEETITLEKWGNYPVKLVDTPNGATVTPTDDVQTWLHCANIWDKSYTTISEVVADTTTLNTLISDNNAVDYMVRSTTWASNVCSNESAMTYIDLNDYCARKLLSDSTWLEAICNSEYFEEVLNVKVPTMTSNTTPYGEASANNYYEQNFPYKVFDNKVETAWSTRENILSGWVCYKFPKPVIVNQFETLNSDGSTKDIIIQGSNDGSDDSWTDLCSYTLAQQNTITKYKINNNKPYLYYRCYIVNTYTSWIGLFHLQFYGREEA